MTAFLDARVGNGCFLLYRSTGQVYFDSRPEYNRSHRKRTMTRTATFLRHSCAHSTLYCNYVSDYLAHCSWLLLCSNDAFVADLDLLWYWRDLWSSSHHVEYHQLVNMEVKLKSIETIINNIIIKQQQFTLLYCQMLFSNHFMDFTISLYYNKCAL